MKNYKFFDERKRNCKFRLAGDFSVAEDIVDLNSPDMSTVNNDNKTSSKKNSSWTLRVNTESTDLNLRAAPGLNSEVIGKLSKGSQVKATGNFDGKWIEVNNDDGETGWAHFDYLFD